MRNKTKGYLYLAVSVVLLGILVSLFTIKQSGYLLILEFCFLVIVSCCFFSFAVKKFIAPSDIEIEGKKINKMIDEIYSEYWKLQAKIEEYKEKKTCQYCKSEIENEDSFYCPFCGSTLNN